MSWPPDDLSERAGTVAAWASAVFVGIAVAYRTLFGARKDLRVERDATSQGESWAAVAAGLRAELEQVRDDQEQILNNYRRERAARMEAEDRAAECERRAGRLEERVSVLERQIIVLGGTA